MCFSSLARRAAPRRAPSIPSPPFCPRGEVLSPTRWEGEGSSVAKGLCSRCGEGMGDFGDLGSAPPRCHAHLLGAPAKSPPAYACCCCRALQRTLEGFRGDRGLWCSLLAWGLGFCFKSSLLVILRCWQRVLSTFLNLVEDTARGEVLSCCPCFRLCSGLFLLRAGACPFLLPVHARGTAVHIPLSPACSAPRLLLIHPITKSLWLAPSTVSSSSPHGIPSPALPEHGRGGTCCLLGHGSGDRWQMSRALA